MMHRLVLITVIAVINIMIENLQSGLHQIQCITVRTDQIVILFICHVFAFPFSILPQPLSQQYTLFLCAGHV